MRRPVTVLGQPHGSQRPGHARGNLLHGQAQVLRPEGNLIFDAHLCELRFRILKDQPDRARQLRDRMLFRVLPGHGYVAAEHAAGDMGRQPVQRQAQG